MAFKSLKGFCTHLQLCFIRPMGKNKLKKFSEMEQIPFVLQYPFARLESEGFGLRGHWARDFFGNDNPVTLELGCGKGEYTVGLARRNPDRNYIGIDIKGARMWSGARQALAEGLGNVAFLRTNIELLDRFFEPGEVDEIWITFPDPQMSKTRKRLTSTRFLELYRRVATPGAHIRLKTDSPFLYTYTCDMAAASHLPVEAATDNLYDRTKSGTGALPEALRQIRTHYEQQWLDRGLTIKYISFVLPSHTLLREPDTEPEHDTYRSYSRGYIQMPQMMEQEGNETNTVNI